MNFNNLFATFNLFLFLTSCGPKGPIVEICIIDKKEGGAQCVQTDHTDKFRTYEELHNYAATPAKDLEKLLKHCKDKDLN